MPTAANPKGRYKTPTYNIPADIGPSIDIPQFDFSGTPSKTREAEDFPSWLKSTTPDWRWDWAWQIYVQRQLARITSGEIRKLMIFIPPQHGKSEMTTVRYPIYRLCDNPALRIIIGAYSQNLAEAFSRKGRRIAESAGLTFSYDSRAVGEGRRQRAVGLWLSASVPVLRVGLETSLLLMTR